MWIMALTVVTVCVVITVIRAFIGPGTPTRLVALDTVNTLVVVAMVILAVVLDQVIFADVAIIYALLAFVTTLYVAKYVQGKKS